MAVEVEARAGTHPAFAIGVDDLRRVLEVSGLSAELKMAIRMIPTKRCPDISSVLEQVCVHLGVSCDWIRCKTSPDGEEGQISSYIVFKMIETADRLILEEDTIKMVGSHSQWPDYLEIRMKAKDAGDDIESQDASEDKGGVEAGVYAALLAAILWRSEHRLIINRCKGD